MQWYATACIYMENDNNIKNQPQKELMSVENFLDIYGINRNRFYSHVRAGRLKITKDGKRTFVKREDAQAWLHKLGTEEE